MDQLLDWWDCLRSTDPVDCQTRLDWRGIIVRLDEISDINF